MKEKIQREKLIMKIDRVIHSDVSVFRKTLKTELWIKIAYIKSKKDFCKMCLILEENSSDK